jgi:spoIIIJ-associated protein
MAERDLDSYLEGIGIDVDGESGSSQSVVPDDFSRPPVEGAEAEEPLVGREGEDDEEEQVADLAHEDGVRMRADDPWGAEEIDFERALAGAGLGGVVPDDLTPDQRAETFLVQLLLYLDPTYLVDVSVAHDGTIHADVSGGDAGRLIGKSGRTLASLEYLSAAVVNKFDGEAPVRVNIDVGGYKRRRDERLRQMARRAAERVRRGGVPVELEPMSAAERRVVHMVLADDPAVESESSGEGRDRRVVVYPAAHQH